MAGFFAEMSQWVSKPEHLRAHSSFQSGRFAYETWGEADRVRRGQ